MARSSTTPATNGASQRGKVSGAQKHLTPADELQALADAVDKGVTLESKFRQKQGSSIRHNRHENGVTVPKFASPKVHVGSIVNDLMLAAGEAGMYGIIFKLMILINQRVEKAKEVDSKALFLKDRSERIMKYFDRMKARLACSGSSPEEQKIVLTEWEENAVLLFTECAQVLGSITSKANDVDQLTRYQCWDKVSRSFTRCFTSPANLKDVDQCISKLENFASGMMLEDQTRTVNNDLPYLGEKPLVGAKTFEMIEELSKLISEPAGRGSRGEIMVVHIIGPPGVGKSRMAKELLHRIHQEQTHVKDCKIEFLQLDFSNCTVVGSNLEPVECQRKLLEQIADGREAEGLSHKDVGRTKIQKTLKAWKETKIGTGRKRKVVMFFDNLPTHTSVLEEILPDDIAKILPAGSCVLVSLRGCDTEWKGTAVYRGIQRLFPIPSCNHKVQKVETLGNIDARNLFEQHVSGTPGLSSDVIHDLIARCDGNPKLLILFGQYVASQQTDRSESFWKDILKKLEETDDRSTFTDEVLDGLWKEYTSKISDAQRQMYARFTAKLALVYRMKLGDLRELEDAMADISHLFDGWNWLTVEAILGKDVLRKLKDKKALSPKFVVDILNKDMHEGSSPVRSSSDVAAVMNKCGRRSSVQLKVVQANSDFRDTARKIHADKHLVAINTSIPAEKLSELERGNEKKRAAVNLRSLCLVACTGTFQLRSLDRIQGLRYLILHKVEDTKGVTVKELKDLCYLHWGSIDGTRFPFEATNLPNLQTLVLTDIDFTTQSQPKLEIPPKLQNLSLIRCRNVNLVAHAIFNSTSLKSVHLQECEGACDFRLSGSIQPTRKDSIPFSLSFQNCRDMERIPAFIQNLQRLKDLVFTSCPNLKGQELDDVWVSGLAKKPSVSTSLETLTFEDCQSLTCLPAEVALYAKTLSELEIISCHIKGIPPRIALFEKLKKLTLASCPAIKTLPPELGDLSNLQKLSMEECRGLTALPKEIGKLQLLRELKLDFCASLQALPVEVESLKRLSGLSMSFCCGLDPKTDPSEVPDLGKLTELRYVNIAGLDLTLLEKLAESANSIHRVAGFTLVKELPKHDNPFNPSFFSAYARPPTPCSSNKKSRLYSSAND